MVLSGPSGVGKGTVVAAAIAARGETGASIRGSISVTTRPPRPGEGEGQHYFFRSAREFDEMVRAGSLLEWASYLDHRYGTPREWVESELALGHDVVLEIEVQGAQQVRERCPEAVLVYMLPPSREELRRRLAGRGSDDAETQRRRLEVAEREIALLRQYDYAIVNDDVAAAARRFLAILEAEHWRTSRLDLQDLA